MSFCSFLSKRKGSVMPQFTVSQCFAVSKAAIPDCGCWPVVESFPSKRKGKKKSAVVLWLWDVFEASMLF